MRRVTPARLRGALAGLAAVSLVAAAAGCSASPGDDLPRSEPTIPGSPTLSPGPTTSLSATETYAVEPPGPLEGRLLTADVLVSATDPLPADLVDGIRRIKRVAAVERLSVGALSVEGRTLTVAAVDPGGYRRYTPVQSAQTQEVWERVASGEVAVDPSVPRRVIDDEELLSLGDADDADRIHVGAFAPLTKRIGAVVNAERGAQLGLPEANALLVSTGRYTPSALGAQLRRAVGGRAAIEVLALEYDVDAVQTAVLTGASVADAVGSFSFTRGPRGTIRPDPAWVATYIRTEQVPILGSVTCNKGMLPQLRAALTEVVQRGLADSIHPEEYAGCYYPRYIGRTPANGLSLHSWGIAVDLNVPGNQRGTVGEMDRQVVDIFEKWGFAWGGRWRYTDPMHFEMNRVVDVG
jgi:hypothetical protein